MFAVTFVSLLNALAQFSAGASGMPETTLPFRDRSSFVISSEAHEKPAVSEILNEMQERAHLIHLERLREVDASLDDIIMRCTFGRETACETVPLHILEPL